MILPKFCRCLIVSTTSHDQGINMCYADYKVLKLIYFIFNDLVGQCDNFPIIYFLQRCTPDPPSLMSGRALRIIVIGSIGNSKSTSWGLTETIPQGEAFLSGTKSLFPRILWLVQISNYLRIFSSPALFSLLSCSRLYNMISRNLALVTLTSSLGNHLFKTGSSPSRRAT